MGLTAGKGRRVKQNSAKTQEDQKKKNPREILQRKDYLCRVLQSWSPPSGAAGAVPCRRTLPCRRLLPYREALPCRRVPPCREILPWLLVGLLCSYTNQQSNISKERVPMRTSQRKANHILTLGAALEEICRVRQGCLGRSPCCRSGFVLDDDHRDLGSLCCSLGQSPNEKQV